MKRLTLFFLVTFLALAARAQQSPGPFLEVSGDVPHARTFELQDWKQLKHVSLTATNTHDKKTSSFSGVPLRELLRDAGVASGEDLRGKAMSTCVVVRASDGYQVAFSLAELDESLGNIQVLIADAEDGKPLAEGTGPLRLVVPSDKRPARWVRMVKAIRIVATP